MLEIQNLGPFLLSMQVVPNIKNLRISLLLSKNKNFIFNFLRKKRKKGKNVTHKPILFSPRFRISKKKIHPGFGFGMGFLLRCSNFLNSKTDSPSLDFTFYSRSTSGSGLHLPSIGCFSGSSLTVTVSSCLCFIYLTFF